MGVAAQVPGLNGYESEVKVVAMDHLCGLSGAGCRPQTTRGGTKNRGAGGGGWMTHIHTTRRWIHLTISQNRWVLC